MLVVGLTGKNCAGKDTAADVLEGAGYGRHSLSDAIREELRREEKEITRENLIEKGNVLRLEGGAGVLAQKISALLEKDKEVVVSIRNPTEVAELRKLDNFLLIGVDAPAQMRFEREISRAREGGNTLTFEEFCSKEEKENSKDPHSQQLDLVLQMADKIIINDGTIQEFKDKVEQLRVRIENERT